MKSFKTILRFFEEFSKINAFFKIFSTVSKVILIISTENLFDYLSTHNNIN